MADEAFSLVLVLGKMAEESLVLGKMADFLV